MKSFLKISLAGLVLASLAVAAHATQPGNNGGGNGPCGVGQQTNGCGGTTPAPVNNGGAGGAGGQGGAGGTGIGVGVGIAAAQANAAAVAAANSSANAAANQAQGQQQGQAQSSRNNNQSRATGGAAAATTGAITNGATTGPITVSVEGAKGDVYVAPAQERNPVNTAYAAPLTSSPETCMGSSSGGAQGANFGVSFGTTWESAKCDRRMFARALDALGLRGAAVSLLCQDADVKDAMEDAGTPCTSKRHSKRAEGILNGTNASEATAARGQYQDPIIRARLGLPPL